MRTTLVILFAGLVLGAVVLTGCVPFLKTVKPQQGEERAAQAKPGAENAAAAEKSGKTPTPSPEELEKLLPAPPPGYKATPSSPAQSLDAVDTREREEIKESALKFAKEIPNVKHMKTCFSKEFGGWYLIVYTQKGKKYSPQHFAWNPRTLEFEPSAPSRLLLTQKELDMQLDVTIKGETCFRLK